MGRDSIKSIFREHWKKAKQEISRRYEPSHWKSIVETVEKMLSCRDPSKGYAEYICTKCGTKKKIGFTCKSRFCSSCGKKYVDEWVNKTVKTIIDISHRHIIFTIAEELRGIIFRDRLLVKVMMDSASKAALEVLRSRGLTSKKEWEEIPFLPYDLLRKKWQYYLLTGVKKILPRTKENAKLIDQMFKNNARGFYVNGESKMNSSRYVSTGI